MSQLRMETLVPWLGETEMLCPLFTTLNCHWVIWDAFLTSQNKTSEQIATRISGVWPALQILLANFIGCFSMMSNVSGLPSATPNVRTSIQCHCFLHQGTRVTKYNDNKRWSLLSLYWWVWHYFVFNQLSVFQCNCLIRKLTTQGSKTYFMYPTISGTIWETIKCKCN